MATPLSDGFALHSAMPTLAAMYGSREAAFIPAVAGPYRERSHFDAQDVLESGHARPHAAQSGWLNRALAGLPRAEGGPLPRQAGVALAAGVPLLLRGPAEVASWSPVLSGIDIAPSPAPATLEPIAAVDVDTCTVQDDLVFRDGFEHRDGVTCGKAVR